MSSRLEAELADFFGTRHAIPVGSGTAGLYWLLEALGARGRRVLVPALVCPNVVVAVLAAGGIPRAVDLSPATYDLSPGAVARALDESVAAVVAVDPFGRPADLETLAELAAPWGCALIEDACQAYGGRVAGRALGGRAQAGVVSFGHAKPVELGGGGLVLTDSDATREALLSLGAARGGLLASVRRNRQARELMLANDYARMLARAREAALLRYRFPPHLWARLGARWRRFLAEQDEVRAHLARAIEIVRALPGVEPFDDLPPGALPWRYSFKARGAAQRDELARRLAQAGVRTTRLYPPPDAALPVEVPGPLPGAELLAARTLNLSYRTTRAKTARLVERLERLAAGARS